MKSNINASEEYPHLASDIGFVRTQLTCIFMPFPFHRNIVHICGKKMASYAHHSGY